MTRDIVRTIAVLGCCSFSQHMPLLFLIVAVPAMLRESGAGLDTVGLTTLIFLPLAVQFLWAPLLDRYQISRLGRWRGWLLVMQAGTGMTLFLMGFFAPTEHFVQFLAFGLLVAFAAATQRIAQVAFATEIMPKEIRPWGNAAISFGGAAGTAAGSIGLVAMAVHTGWFWVMAFSALMMLAVAPLLLLCPKLDRRMLPRAAAHAGFRAILSVPNGKRMAARILAISLPLGGLYGQLQPFLIDAGFSVFDVGLINGIGYLVVWLVLGPIVARLVQTQPAQTLNLAAFATIVSAAGVMLFADLAEYRAHGILFAAVGLVLGAMALGLVMLQTAFMNNARDESVATDVNVLICMLALSLILASALGGVLAENLGYAALFGLCAGLALVSAAGFALVGRSLPRPEV